MADARKPSQLLLRMAIPFLLGFVVTNGVIVWRVRSQISEGYGDFASFYTAGKIVSLGASDRLYDPRLQWQVQQQFAANVKTRRGPLPYIRPPYQAFVFLPLSYLSYPAACWLWLALKSAILLIVPWVLPALKGEGQGHLLWKVLLCFSFFPVGFDMLQGQDSILLLLVLAVALRLLLRKSDALSGGVLALGLFKFHIIIPLFLIIACKRRSRFAFGFVGMGLVLFLISLAMVHWSGVLQYPRYIWMLNQVPGLGMVKPVAMPNARGILAALLGSASLPTVAQGFLVLVVFGGIVLAARAWRDTDPAATMRGFAFSVPAVLVTSYYANSYDLTLLLIPLLMLTESVVNAQSSWPRTTFLIAAGALASTPVLWLLVSYVNQFCWIGLVVAALGASILAGNRALQETSVTNSIA